VSPTTRPHLVTADAESPTQVEAWDRMTADERAIVVRAIAAATLKWALAELEREQDARDARP
jgi:hypothetical protein